MRPQQLLRHLEECPSPPRLLDVREVWEFQLCKLPDSELIPLGQLHQRLEQLDPERQTVLICHHGIRSRQAAMYLERQGFKDVINLSGGVDAWAREIDPEMSIY